MPAPDLDQRLRALGQAASAATNPRDPARTERRGRWRRRARRSGAGLAIASLAAAVLVTRNLVPNVQDGRGDGVTRQPSAPGSTREVAHGGLVFSVPASWDVSLGNPCPGLRGPELTVDLLPDPPPTFDREIRQSIGCDVRAPFAVIRSMPDAELPGGTERTVNGLRVLVNTGPPAWGVNNQVPAGWSIHHAVFRSDDDGAGLLVEVVAPGADSSELFERILTSVRPGRQAGSPGTARVHYGGASFEVPAGWRVVDQGHDPCASRTDAVFLGVDLSSVKCTRPDRYLEVTRSTPPSGPLVKLNGFGLQRGSSGRALPGGRWRAEDMAELAVPALRFRLVTVSRGEGQPADVHLLDAVLVSLRPA